MTQNWLHINPVSGTGSTQFEIRADDNVLGITRKAKIIITAGTMTRTIDVVQGIADCDIFAVYYQPSSGLTLVNNNNQLRKVIISSEYGKIELDPSSTDWGYIDERHTYRWNNNTPTALTVQYYFNTDFDGILQPSLFSGLDNLEEVSIRNSVHTLKEAAFELNNDLNSIELYSGVTGYSGTVSTGSSAGYVYYNMPNAVAIDCPNLSRFYGDSPLILTGAPNTSAMLVYNNMLIGVVQYLSITDYYIPDGITGLSSYVFSTKHDYPTVTGISIPDSVVTIGDYCFRNQSNISALTLSSGLTSIGSGVFSACTDLLSITCNATTAPPVNNYTFSGISTGGTLYYPHDSDYSSWFIQANQNRLLDYYSWRDGIPPVMTITPNDLLFSHTGDSQTITITANKLGWYLTTSESWITITSTPATGETTHTITTSYYGETANRVGSVQVIYNNEPFSSITVSQLGNDTSFQLSTNYISTSQDGVFTVETDKCLEVDYPDWVYFISGIISRNNVNSQYSGLLQTGLTTVNFSLTKTVVGRVGTIRFRYDNVVLGEITVNQAANGLDPTGSYFGISFYNTGGYYNQLWWDYYSHKGREIIVWSDTYVSTPTGYDNSYTFNREQITYAGLTGYRFTITPKGNWHGGNYITFRSNSGSDYFWFERDTYQSSLGYCNTTYIVSHYTGTTQEIIQYGDLGSVTTEYDWLHGRRDWVSSGKYKLTITVDSYSGEKPRIGSIGGIYVIQYPQIQ